jgi:hypothetical protein
MNARRIENVVRQLLPERRVYVLFASKLPQQYRPRGCFGMTGRGLDLVLRDAIGRKWKGRGAVMVLDEDQARWFAREFHPFLLEAIAAPRELWKAAAHELAHIAGRTILPSEETAEDPGFCEVVDRTLSEFCANSPPVALVCPVPWEGHDGQFIRLLFHTAHRVRLAAGDWIGFADWFDSQQYGLPSREDQYRAALGDEPERLADVPLSKLPAVPPPTAFAELWAYDVREWWSAIKNPTNQQTAALVRGLEMFSPPVFRKALSMTETLERIRNTFSARRKEQAGDYAGLVGAVASGEQVDADKAAEILDLCDKSPAELAADVAALQERQRLRAAMDAKPAAEKRIAEIDVALGRIETRRRAADEKFDAEAWPIENEREQLRATVSAADDAKRALFRGFTDSAILQQSAKIQQAAESIDKEIARFARDREKFTEERHKAEERADQWSGPADAAHDLKQVETYSAYIDNINRQIAKLEADRGNLLAEQKELDLRRLMP